MGEPLIGPTDVSSLERLWLVRTRDPHEVLEEARDLLTKVDLATDPTTSAMVECLAAYAESQLSDFESAAARAQRGLTLLESADKQRSDPTIERWMARLHVVLGACHRRTGDLSGANNHFERSLQLARSIKDPHSECAALNGLGYVTRSAGDYDRSMENHQQALLLAREIDRPDEEATALLGIGNTLERLGRYDEARDHYEHALEIADKIQSARLQAYATDNISIIYQRHGDLPKAIEFTQRSIQHKEALGDLWGLGVSLNNLSIIYRTIGQYDAALEVAVRSLDITRQIKDREGESVALNTVGQVYESLGDLTGVMHYFTASLAISREIGYLQGEAYSLLHIGRLYNTLGDQPRALMHVLRSRRMFADSGDRYGERGAIIDLGYIHQQLDHPEEAEEYFTASLRLAEALGDPIGTIDSLLALGTLALATSRSDVATEHLHRAVDLSLDIGATEQRKLALEGLAQAYAERGDESASSEYRREARECLRTLFDDERTRRVREILFDFEGGHLRRQGEDLGLDPNELLEVAHAAEVSYRLGRNRFPAESMRSSPVAGTDSATISDDRRNAAAIDVTTLGGLTVIVNGHKLEASAWKRKRARDLFKLLLAHYGRPLTIDEILEHLWGGEASGRNGDLLVMNAVSHIRAALEPKRLRGQSSRYLVAIDGAYILDFGDEGWVDYLRFKELIVAARHSVNTVSRTRQYAAAAELYGGDFLKEDYYEPWSANERGLLRDAYLEALEYLAAEHLRNGVLEEAVELARRILGEDRTSERAWEILLLGLKELGRLAEAQRMLAECAQAFEDELDEAIPERILARMAR